MVRDDREKGAKVGEGNEIKFLEDQLPRLAGEAAQKRGDLWCLMRILNLGTEAWLGQRPILKTSDFVDLIFQDLKVLGETREAAAYLWENPDTNLFCRLWGSGKNFYWMGMGKRKSKGFGVMSVREGLLEGWLGNRFGEGAGPDTTIS